jgi:DNA-directed RNA polymerase specialized sigma24 family protein
MLPKLKCKSLVQQPAVTPMVQTSTFTTREQALLDFVHQYERSVYTFCYRLLDDAEAAEATSQAVFADLSARRPEVSCVELLGTVCHHCLSCLSVHFSGNGRTETNDDALQCVLRQLTPENRSILLLRDSYGLGCGEVAAILRMNNDDIRQRLHEVRHEAAVTLSNLSDDSTRRLR